MLGIVRIRIGLVHYETYRDFLQIPGNYPDDEDMAEIKAIDNQYAQGNCDLHGNPFFSYLTFRTGRAEVDAVVLV